MPKPAIWTVLCLILLFSACDTGTMIYTQNELSDMYGITVTSDALALEDRSITSPEDPFVVTLEIDANAPQPAAVRIELFDALNENIASVLFVNKAENNIDSQVDEGSSEAELSIPVASMDGELPPIQFPENLADGYYRLETSILDFNQRTLASSSHTLLIYTATAPELRITLHPAAIHTGRKALIKAGFDGVVSDQAWIRWLVNGTLWQEGSVSSRMDRIVWDTPDNQGIHTVQAEYYPFEPPADIQVQPYATRSIKIPVSKLENNGLEADINLYGMVSLDSAVAEFSSRTDPGRAETTSFGTLYPEASSRGFGHALEENGGLFSYTDFLPPAAESEDFSLRFALEPLPAYGQYLPNGSIYRLEDENNSDIFVLGVHSGQLYVRAGTEAESLLPLPDQALLIILNARSADGWLQITVHVNNNLFVSTTVPEFRSSVQKYRHNLAGVGGFPAIYEEAQSFTGIISPFIATEQHWSGDALLAVKDFDFERQTGETGFGQLLARTETEDQPAAAPAEPAPEVPVEATARIGEPEKLAAPAEAAATSGPVVAADATALTTADPRTEAQNRRQATAADTAADPVPEPIPADDVDIRLESPIPPEVKLRDRYQLLQLPLAKSSLQNGVTVELGYSGTEPYFELLLNETVRLLFGTDRKLSVISKTALPEAAEQVVNMELPFDAISDDLFRLGLRFKNNTLQLYQAGQSDSIQIPETGDLNPAVLSLHLLAQSGTTEADGQISIIPHTLRVLAE